jgi:hypothetical protein
MSQIDVRVSYAWASLPTMAFLPVKSGRGPTSRALHALRSFSVNGRFVHVRRVSSCLNFTPCIVRSAMSSVHPCLHMVHDEAGILLLRPLRSVVVVVGWIKLYPQNSFMVLLLTRVEEATKNTNK